MDSDLPLRRSHRSGRNNQQERGWTWLLVLATLTTTLGCALPAGYNIGVVNNPQTVIKQFCNETIQAKYNTTLTEGEFNILWSSVVSIFIVGGVIGSLCGAWLADKFGRKGSIIISDALGVLAALSFIFSKEIASVELLLAGRLLVGLSSGLTTAVMPMYLAELSPTKLRGATGVMCQLGVTIGVLLSQVLGLSIVIGTASLWHWLLALYAVLIIITAFALPVLPESPKYLYVVRGLEDKAVKELERLRDLSKEYLTAEIDAFKQERRNQQQVGRWSAMSVFRDRKLMLPMLLVISLQAGQQLSGVNAVFYYSSQIFRSAGLAELEAQFGSLGAGIVNLAVAALSVYTMHNFPRRNLILTSCCGAIVSLCILTISITYSNQVGWLQYLPIVAVLLFVFMYGLGLGPIPYFVGSELFEVGPRPTAMAWGSMANWAGNFLVGMTFPSLNALIGQYVFICYIFVVACLTYFIIMYFPETKGLEQREVAAMLQDGFSSIIRRKVRPANNRDVIRGVRM